MASHSSMNEDIIKVVYTQEQIEEHIRRQGEDITRDHAGEEVVLLCVLRGAAIFMADLARSIDLPIEMEYMAVSSYGSQTKSSGVVRITKDLSTDIAGRHVIIAEDIIDSGLTLKYLIKYLGARNPASLEIASLFIKKDVQQVEIDCKYPGLPVPNEYVVGFGLDYAEKYRNLPYLGILDPKIYS